MVLGPPILATPCSYVGLNEFNPGHIRVIIWVTGSKSMGQWVIWVNTCDLVATSVATLIYIHVYVPIMLLVCIILYTYHKAQNFDREILINFSICRNFTIQNFPPGAICMQG